MFTDFKGKKVEFQVHKNLVVYGSSGLWCRLYNFSCIVKYEMINYFGVWTFLWKYHS